MCVYMTIITTKVSQSNSSIKESIERI
jgi:hypothetical protein